MKCPTVWTSHKACKPGVVDQVITLAGVTRAPLFNRYVHACRTDAGLSGGHGHIGRCRCVCGAKTRRPKEGGRV